MIYLSTASSFWLSFNSSYDHEFHLSKRFGMSPQDYEHLLVAAHFAHFHTKWGFSIKKVVDSPVIALPSRPLVLSACRHLVFLTRLSSFSCCTALSSSHCAGWLLLCCFSSPHRLVLSLRCTLVLSLSSHCAALSPCHCTIWLLCRLLLRCRLYLSSSSHCVALSLSNCAGWLFRHLSLRRCLILSSRCCLVLSSYSHCAALLSSNRAGWLLP